MIIKANLFLEWKDFFLFKESYNACKMTFLQKLDRIWSEISGKILELDWTMKNPEWKRRETGMEFSLAIIFETRIELGYDFEKQDSS